MFLRTLSYLRNCSQGTVTGSAPSVNLPQELYMQLLKELFETIFLRNCSWWNVPTTIPQESINRNTKIKVFNLGFINSCNLCISETSFGLWLVEPFSTFLSSVGKITKLILICFNMQLLILLDTQRPKKIQNYAFPYRLVIVILFGVFGLNFEHSPDGQIDMNDV